MKKTNKNKIENKNKIKNENTKLTIYCEICFEQKYKYICSKCKCGFYCSKECQANDWHNHKKFCNLWNKKGKFNNPFYTDKIIKNPKIFAMSLFDSTEKNFNYDMVNLSTLREIHGETQLQIAVSFGDISHIKQLISKGICINAYDSHHNDALYIACTHDGKNNILKNNITLRNTIVKLLLDNGSDPHQRGGVSGMRTFEIAEKHGYTSTRDLIKNHKFFMTFAMIREYFNDSTPIKKIKELVQQYHYLYWVLNSIHWFFIPNRESLNNMIMYPKIMEKVTTFNSIENDYRNSQEMIESLFLDYQLKYNKFLTQLELHSRNYTVGE